MLIFVGVPSNNLTNVIIRSTWLGVNFLENIFSYSLSISTISFISNWSWSRLKYCSTWDIFKTATCACRSSLKNSSIFDCWKEYLFYSHIKNLSKIKCYSKWYSHLWKVWLQDNFDETFSVRSLFHWALVDECSLFPWIVFEIGSAHYC